jgi:hypothetical protein
VPELVIDPRFCGPPDSANGGYTCGLLASFVAGPAQVTLRVPPPLGRPLRVEADGDGAVTLHDGDTLVAEAVGAEVSAGDQPTVTLEQAEAAADRYEWADPQVHPYPTCFVCGPVRASDDGMRVFAGPVPGFESLYAAPWSPHHSLQPSADGAVAPEFVWAALDCPGGLVTNTFAPAGRILLGRLAANVVRPVPSAADYVLTAWPIERDGRKMRTGSALYSAEGLLHARAEATWIEVPR